MLDIFAHAGHQHMDTGTHGAGHDCMIVPYIISALAGAIFTLIVVGVVAYFSRPKKKPLKNKNK